MNLLKSKLLSLYTVLLFTMSIQSKYSLADFPHGAFSETYLNSQSITALATVAAVIFYLLSEIIPRRRMVDKQGNTIPDGPWGMPIVGARSTYYYSTVLINISVLRLVPLPHALP